MLCALWYVYSRIWLIVCPSCYLALSWATSKKLVVTCGTQTRVDEKALTAGICWKFASRIVAWDNEWRKKPKMLAVDWHLSTLLRGTYQYMPTFSFHWQNISCHFACAISCSYILYFVRHCVDVYTYVSPLPTRGSESSECCIIQLDRLRAQLALAVRKMQRYRAW